MSEETKREEFKSKARDDYRRYQGLMWTAIVAAVLIIIFYFCVQRYQGLLAGLSTLSMIFQPIIIGLVMAFLMNPIMKFLEEKLLPLFLKKTKNERRTKQRIRALTSVIALLLLLSIVFLFFAVVAPIFVETLNDLVRNVNEKVYNVLDWANDITKGRFEKQILGAKDDEKITYAINTAVSFIRSYFDLGEQEQVVNMVTRLGISIGRTVFNFFIGIVVSVYTLMSKEKFKAQIKKLLYGIFDPNWANVFVRIGRKTDDVFYGFIIGKIIDSIIIGVICYISMLIMQMPYAVLCSVIIGITNIIPVFGPYIGAVPTVIIIFVNNPMQGIYFLLFVLILQQIDGNIIGPKILGENTGLSSFWVVLAIVVGGGLFGVPGMIIGVPMMSVVYYICGEVATYLLQRRNLPTETEAYVDVREVDPGTNQLVLKDASDEKPKKHSRRNKNSEVTKEEKEADPEESEEP